MKKQLMIALLGVLTTLSACKDENEVSAEAAQLKKISATWEITSALKDDEEITGYDNFRLILSGSPDASSFTYATSGRPSLSPWPSGGTWVFGSSVKSQILRDSNSDEVLILYSLDGNTLSLEFNFAGEGYENIARINSPIGQWKFTFSKQ